MTSSSFSIDFAALTQQIKTWGSALGFQAVGITDIDLSVAEKNLQAWLARHFHGSMSYMEKHGSKRSRPAELVPHTTRIISARLDYLPEHIDLIKNLRQSEKAYISNYALGRDYHKVVRKKLLSLAKQISAAVPNTHYRVFVDSAPVLEKAIAEKAGLGWIGKNTLLINSRAGSWFFIGEIYTNLPLHIDIPATHHCGSCQACLKICPTQAIVGPYQLDARRCISYLTIENRNSIPIEFRKAIGNRIFGCDDCQLICPWNKFAKFTEEKDFHPRHHFVDTKLLDLFNWSESEFLHKTEGSAIRRTGYIGWLRNIAVALGNAAYDEKIVTALQSRLNHESILVREHCEWALQEQMNKKTTASNHAYV